MRPFSKLVIATLHWCVPAPVHWVANSWKVTEFPISSTGTFFGAMKDNLNQLLIETVTIKSRFWAIWSSFWAQKCHKTLLRVYGTPHSFGFRNSLLTSFFSVSPCRALIAALRFSTCSFSALVSKASCCSSDMKFVDFSFWSPYDPWEVLEKTRLKQPSFQSHFQSSTHCYLTRLFGVLRIFFI